MVAQSCPFATNTLEMVLGSVAIDTLWFMLLCPLRYIVALFVVYMYCPAAAHVSIETTLLDPLAA